MTTNTCGFLNLPPELRNQIYTHVKVGIPPKRLEKIGVIDGIMVSHPLTRTCRRIRSESLALFNDIDCTFVADIRAYVVDFRFESLLALVEKIIPDDEEEGASFLSVDVHLTNPAKLSFESLRRWLHACEHSPALSLMVRDYMIDFDWRGYDVQMVRRLCEIIKEKKTPGRPDRNEIHFEAHMAMTRRQDELAGRFRSRSIGRKGQLGVHGSACWKDEAQ